MHARRGVDARNPQPPKITLARATVLIRIPQAVHDRFIGRPKMTRPRPSVAASHFQNLFVPPMAHYPSLNPSHRLHLLILLPLTV
jgi:hypothetical protein